MLSPKGALPESQYEDFVELKLKKDKTPAEQKKLQGMEVKLSKSEELTDTCKGFLARTYAIEKYYSGRKGKPTAAMVKGTVVQREAFDLFIAAEEKHYNSQVKLLKNEFITGVPDLFDGTIATSSQEIIEVRNEADIAKISGKVIKCREYLKEFEEKHKFFTKNYRREHLLALKNGK
jgi:hypothetical protein